MTITEPCISGDAVSFYLRYGIVWRHFLISTQALRMLGQHHGFVMDTLNLYRAHEAAVHAVARALAEKQADDHSISIGEYDFPPVHQQLQKQP
jgi:hypothetical protein